MGQRVYILSQDEYSNILGIFTNIRQCRKFIENFENKDQIILHEIRLNEPNKGKKDMTKLLKENTQDIKEMEKMSKDEDKDNNI